LPISRDLPPSQPSSDLRGDSIRSTFTTANHTSDELHTPAANPKTSRHHITPLRNHEQDQSRDILEETHDTQPLKPKKKKRKTVITISDDESDTPANKTIAKPTKSIDLIADKENIKRPSAPEPSKKKEKRKKNGTDKPKQDSSATRSAQPLAADSNDELDIISSEQIPVDETRKVLKKRKRDQDSSNSDGHAGMFHVIAK
jgi:outer membrane translocation and assembly module TamA